MKLISSDFQPTHFDILYIIQRILHPYGIIIVHKFDSYTRVFCYCIILTCVFSFFVTLVTSLQSTHGLPPAPMLITLDSQHQCACVSKWQQCALNVNQCVVMATRLQASYYWGHQVLISNNKYLFDNQEMLNILTKVSFSNFIYDMNLFFTVIYKVKRSWMFMIIIISKILLIIININNYCW